MSSTSCEVYKAIAAIQGELAKEGISKDRKNQQQGFAYRGIDDVYASLSPLMAEHKLCILPRVVSRDASERTSAKGGVLFYTAVTVDFDIVSAIDGSKHTVTAVGEAFDSGDKSIGKAQSYAYKAMAFMLFAIPVEGQDNDPDAHSHEVKPKGEKAASTPPPKADTKATASPEQVQKLRDLLMKWCNGSEDFARSALQENSAFTKDGKTFQLEWDKLPSSSAKWVTGVTEAIQKKITESDDIPF